MAISSAPRDYRTLIAAASLIVGPLLMAIGDLLHPKERMAAAEQIAILVDHASRWYTAHLLLFVGMILFIPGLLALSALTAARRPAVGYAARILILVGTAALASIFVGEMLVGRFVLDGADPAAATDLLESMFSGPILAAVGPAMLAFFVGTAAFAIPLMRTGSRVGWAAAIILTRRASYSRRDPLRPSHSQPNRQHSGLLRERNSRLADSSGCNWRDRAN